MNKRNGFTLIEILLVVVIIGIMLAVIVPRAWRANTDAKYNILRQHSTEIASFGIQWCEDQLRSQDDDSPGSLADYLSYLCGTQGGASSLFSFGDVVGQFIFYQSSYPSFSYGNYSLGYRLVNGTSPQPPSGAAADLVPKEKVLRNPFTGQNALSPGQENSPGAMAFFGAQEGDSDYIYCTVLFRAVDMQLEAPTSGARPATSADFYAIGPPGTVPNTTNYRAGVFAARYKHFTVPEVGE